MQKELLQKQVLLEQGLQITLHQRERELQNPVYW
jgi:hypothetical protein